jgi:hypothetical protein
MPHGATTTVARRFENSSVVGKWRNTGEPVTELRKGSVRLQEAIAGDANTQGSQYWCVWFETKDGITRNEM